MQKTFISRDKLRVHFAQFNEDDEELYSNIPNDEALTFLEEKIPLFDCPDGDFERTFYFRWWTYRKHIKKTPDGYVVTEFLPNVNWSGLHNTISCPAGHHFYEGRWLSDAKYLDDYANFWLRKGGEARLYSFWIADAIYARHLVTPNKDQLVEFLPLLIENYEAWEDGWNCSRHRIGQRENGLFYTLDDRDGAEMSIGGNGFRPTLNSYMYGDAVAIAKIARIAGEEEQGDRFEKKAAELKGLIQEKLWDHQDSFFKVLPEDESQLADVRELYGYIPWYFNLPDAGYESGWRELMDPKGFFAPYGPTFAEQRHPEFKLSYEGHECQWNGPSWPMATSSVLTSLGNLLNNYQQKFVDKKDYFEILKIYTKSHQRTREDGKTVPWIDENLNPYTGEWISRTRLKTWENGTWCEEKGGYERGKDYNHSSYNDLIITGLVGLRPRSDHAVEVNPLIPEGTWDYFCLENISYHGFLITILWDKTGERYNNEKGLSVFADGKRVAHSPTLSRVTGSLI